jgi:hypothetical protein
MKKFLKTILKFVPFKNTFRKFIFNQIYKRNLWEGQESISGIGSSMAETKNARKALEQLIRKHKIKSIADVPCGDFYWMRHVKLGNVTYRGYDIVDKLVKQARKKYGTKKITFETRDMVTDIIPKSDLVICRDGLVHLGHKHILKTLRNFKKSGSKYLLATTFPNVKVNEDIPDGMWRRINLQKAPYHLPKPIQLINEGSKEDKHKALGLWDLRKIRV